MQASFEGELRPAILVVGGVSFVLRPRAQGGFRAQRMPSRASDRAGELVGESAAHEGEMEGETNPHRRSEEESHGESPACRAVGHRGVADTASFVVDR